MTTADKAPAVSGQRAADLLIVGGGIMGLWAAVLAARAGLDTVLVERGRLGSGASGGLLGALMPHMPDQWNDKKQFQFDALVSLEAEIAALEAETGLSAGYRRSGRIISLAKPHLRDIAIERSDDAKRHWRSGDQSFAWHVLDEAVAPGWPEPSSMASGFVHDTLAGRVSPRALLRVLETAIRHSARVWIIEGAAVRSLDGNRADLSDGETLTFGHAIVAAGVQSFPVLDRVLGVQGKSSGTAVKGQAALLKARLDPHMPVIFRDGLYIVPHEDGSVAVGSTSENTFDSPFTTDGQLDVLIASARSLVPALAEAPVFERWAGLRPKAIGRDPMVGAVPNHPSIVMLTGGFKVSFGLAHRLAAAAVGDVVGLVSDVPASFRTEAHIAVLVQKNPA
ncbi:NAD(P)/FAD-dependent oxidoreductase [Pararhizobium sp.]|uniref:NAD(P)/FAD-dependent oxidoreductase n=1 Tax=Pararhizobium sp. TaxID=1977563 RepID=UPI002725BACD|nr:FAD-binding oxidoreductase [Pararhizobium sp.]MDO9414915.1 FAD-binding oxidoreductase [Pararhizobium sp.]